MTLPSSGVLTLADIQTEFGGSNPISLNEYYAGGAYVSPGTTGAFGAVPSSGQIDVNVFHGTSKITGELHTLTQGTSVIKTAIFYGFISGTMGSISPTTSALIGGDTISACYWISSNDIIFVIGANVAQNAFTTLTITATPYSSASASYATGGGSTSWTWAESVNRFPSAGTYSVTLA